MAPFIPKNPDFAARVRDSFNRQGAMVHIGARMTRIEPGFVDITVDYRPELSQQHGYFHGGIVGMIADSAGGYAAFSLMPADASVLTVEYKINLLAPSDGNRLVARGRVTKPGRTLSVCHVDVFVERDGREHLCATLLQTLMTMTGKSDGLASDKKAS
ncbi:MAG: PaaI family thioesterase [Alphaproteobacteria bacterium]|nr:PaaI family thioesterase [Alphaproteobacteria bacterium]